MNGQKFTPMLKASGLWAKTSAKGGRYLTGRLGGVKVLIMANRHRQSNDDPSHNLFFVEAPDRRQGGQERGSGQEGTTTPPPASPRLPQPQRTGSQPHAGANDYVPRWER